MFWNGSTAFNDWTSFVYHLFGAMQSSPNASVVLDSATSSQVELPYRTPTIETPLIVEPEEEPEVIVKVNKNGFTTWVSGEGEGGEPPNLE